MSSLVSELYRHCPRCGSAATAVGIVFDCCACGLHLYFNPAMAVVGIILDSRDRVLLIRRAREPGKGKLAFSSMREAWKKFLARRNGRSDRI